jgi:hypothetical protein
VFILKNGEKAKVIKSIDDIPKDNREYLGEYMSINRNWFRIYQYNNNLYAVRS